MIVVKLLGGLGNQLFQYALGRQLEIKNKSRLYLDLSNFDVDTLRKYELGNLNIAEHFVPPLLLKILLKLRILKKYFQKGRNYDEGVFDAGSNIYLVGYWQSEKYFKAIKGILVDEIIDKDVVNSYHQFSDLFECNTVALHVRRQDYVLNSETANHHGALDVEYYKNAVDLMNKNVSDPHYIVFTDDVEWAKANIAIDKKTTYWENDSENKSWHDLILMSSCKHFIIANSSYSWWAAWLAEKETTVIIAPSRWFSDAPDDARDIVPTRWKRV